MTGLTSPYAPGLWAVFTGDNPVFMENIADAGEGLEGLAEDANPSNIFAAVMAKSNVESSGVFNMPVGSSSAGPIFPGNSFEFSFTAGVNDYLVRAAMLGQSNDIFYAPGETGIKLFDNSENPVTGDITSMFYFWDAGTEVNEFPGAGLNQAPRQSAPNTGAAEHGTVRKVFNNGDGFTYPAVAGALRISIETE
jgi:hypothetical protein